MVRGYVLAGGASARMGVDKARLIGPDGWPLAVRMAAVVRAACGNVALVRRGAPDGLPWPDGIGGALDVVREADVGDRHPLIGVCTALDHAGTDVLVVPCDLPWLDAAAVRALLAVGGAAVARSDRCHPVVAVYPAASRTRLARLVAQGRPAREAVSDAVAVDLPPETLRNVNRPEDVTWPLPGERLGGLRAVVGPAGWARLVAGEVGRLRARGARWGPPGD